MYNIKDLIHNSPKGNEILRTKMYVLGFDFYATLTTNDNPPKLDSEDPYYSTVISGYSRKMSKINLHRGEECYKNTENITHHLYYTELDLIVSKGAYNL